MIEVRFHGRGGQGAVTAAELVAQAAIEGNMYAQAFPNFGPERRGAPVTAFLRISDSPIYLRERIESPDVVVVLDPTLIGMVDFTSGLIPGKMLIINAPPDQPKFIEKIPRCYILGLVDASRIAAETINVPITNTAIIGALVKVTGVIDRDTLIEPFKHRFGRLAEKNLSAMRKAFDETKVIDPSLGDEAICDLNTFSDWDACLSKEALHPWHAIGTGCDIDRPGSCRDFSTGNWRTSGYPVIDRDKCISCGICWIMCPDQAFSHAENGSYTWNGRYCKGCGICAAACPKRSISMEAE